MVSQMLWISGGCWGLLAHGHISITKRLALLDPGLALRLILTWFDTKKSTSMVYVIFLHTAALLQEVCLYTWIPQTKSQHSYNYIGEYMLNMVLRVRWP